MNLTEIKEVVIEETRRTDKADQIHRIVREAITTVHSLKLFPRDLMEDIVVLNAANLMQFKIQLPPRWREFECVRPVTTSGVALRTHHRDGNYELVRPRDMVNNSFDMKSDICYVTGAALAVKASIAPPALYIAWYPLPEVADNNLETWLMELHPQVFIDTAKKLFYRRNGREDVARQYDQDLQTMYFQIISDYGVGD